MNIKILEKVILRESKENKETKKTIKLINSEELILVGKEKVNCLSKRVVKGGEGGVGGESGEGGENRKGEKGGEVIMLGEGREVEIAEFIDLEELKIPAKNASGFKL